MPRLITTQQWNESMKTNGASVAKMLLTKPDQLAPVLTYLMGNEDKRFPLMYLSEGMRNTVEITTDEYEYDVIGRLFKAVPLAEACTTVNAGIAGSSFVIKFGENLFPKKYTILSPNGYQLVVQDSQNIGGIWNFTVTLVSKSNASYIPSSELAAGNLFSLGWYAAASWGSTGSESTSTAPYKVRGDVSTIRKSYKWEGNAKQLVANIPVKTTSGGTTNLWWPFEEYQHNLSFRRECETNYWYSQSNRNADGTISERDAEGNPIYRGSGLFEQIINKDSYSVLTADKIQQTIRDTFFDMSDTQDKVVTLFTGTGGRSAFDDAMKTELLNKQYIKLSDNKFVGGEGYNLSLGGFFSTYEHVDGYKVIIRTVPLMDDGPQAQASPRHPQTNLPLESYRMAFVDTSVYDGSSNLVMANKKGRAMVRGMVKGMNEVGNDMTGNDFIASDKDASSLHMLKTGQVVLRRFNTSIDLKCTAGL